MSKKMTYQWKLRELMAAQGWWKTTDLTPLLADLFPSEEEELKRLNRIPLGRFGLPEDIVYAALYLASDESSWMTGTEFVVDGGITANYF